MIFESKEATTSPVLSRTGQKEQHGLSYLQGASICFPDETGVRIPVEFNLRSLVLVSLAHPDHKLLSDHRVHENRC